MLFWKAADNTQTSNSIASFPIAGRLTDEQKKASKAMTTTGTKKRTAVKRERKVDEDKAVLMDILTDALVDSEVLITKQKTEAEMDFTFKGAEYTLKIIKHRPPKAEKKA